MQKLNLPSYSFKLKNTKNKTLIFDKFRKKYVVLTPEEWVRQHIACFLLEEKKYPISLISIEKQLLINNLKKRTDIIIFNAFGNPEIMVECKAPSIKITQETFDQIARYNLKIKANYLFVTNGLDHFYCQMDFENETYVFLQELPDFIKKTL
ncbi:type I restriction enzyme HsdR N-terminal domain-containing protein [Polaribacter sp.]|uniref:type I restriction enzyme HsdR N-terminal domain-containing protein n=1 Tax=Polaribacter sp. TaxID=1920175 RepID=UPI004047DA93